MDGSNWWRLSVGDVIFRFAFSHSFLSCLLFTSPLSPSYQRTALACSNTLTGGLTTTAYPHLSNATTWPSFSFFFSLLDPPQAGTPTFRHPHLEHAPMKFLEYPGIDAINSALNFDTPECKVFGRIEPYSCKSTKPYFSPHTRIP